MGGPHTNVSVCVCSSAVLPRPIPLVSPWIGMASGLSPGFRRSDPLPDASRSCRLATLPALPQIVPVDGDGTPSAKTAGDENAALGMRRRHAAAGTAVVVVAGTLRPFRLQGVGTHRKPPCVARHTQLPAGGWSPRPIEYVNGTGSCLPASPLECGHPGEQA